MVVPITGRKKQDTALSGTNLARAGDYNQRVILQAIRANGAITRAELASISGLTHQSAINISRKLIADGLVLDIGAIAGARGQPATRLAVNPDGAYALGLNIDREHMTLVLMNLLGEVRERIYVDAHFALPGEVLEFVRGGLEHIFKKRLIPRKRLIGLGLAVPERLGGVDVLERPAAYDEWSNFDIVSVFSKALGFPVYAENDATSAAIGELQFGQGINHKNFVYTLISAGIGCGLIVNGQAYAGGLAHAGEIGNIPVHTSDSGQQTLWDVVSLYALYRKLQAHGIVVSRPEDLDSDDETITPAIEEWIDEAAAQMIEPFLAITYILTPDMHVIGGQLPAFIVDKLCTKLNALLNGFERKVPLARFRPSTTSVDAAAMGAAVVVFQNRLLPSPEVLLKI